MRLGKLSIVALVAVAAGLSLTACNDDTDSASGTAPSTAVGSTLDDGGSSGSSSGSSGTTAGGTSSSTANGTGTSATSGSGSSGSSGGSGTADGGMCKTANLSFSVSGGMGEGEILVNMKNTGAGTCTMHGFPGVDLKSNYGTQSVDRSSVSAPDVTLASGEETRFTLHYPENTSGGSGVTFTSMVVTPPNETHSHTVPVSINVPVTDSTTSSITVDPVGAGK
ncbi:DUF4232 domain-containing protein [Actinacidiphila sp. bgisy144]|uniref:DUF4232 domain-containing protein n=1 Tax=unclassified Actinacidiphila TaxID=2995708 RepID=UPI003EB92264